MYSYQLNILSLYVIHIIIVSKLVYFLQINFRVDFSLTYTAIIPPHPLNCSIQNVLLGTGRAIVYYTAVIAYVCRKH